MCECMTKRAHRIESVSGFSDPAAKGAMVKGMRPAETILCHCQFVVPHHMMQELQSSSCSLSSIPLETPVVAAMGIVWLGYRHRVVGGSDNLLGQWGQNLVALSGVEGGDACGLGNG